MRCGGAWLWRAWGRHRDEVAGRPWLHGGAQRPLNCLSTICSEESLATSPWPFATALTFDITAHTKTTSSRAFLNSCRNRNNSISCLEKSVP